MIEGDDKRFALAALLRADASNDEDCGNAMIPLPKGEYEGLELRPVGPYPMASRRNIAEWLRGQSFAEAARGGA